MLFVTPGATSWPSSRNTGSGSETLLASRALLVIRGMSNAYSMYVAHARTGATRLSVPARGDTNAHEAHCHVMVHEPSPFAPSSAHEVEIKALTPQSLAVDLTCKTVSRSVEHEPIPPPCTVATSRNVPCGSHGGGSEVMLVANAGVRLSIPSCTASKTMAVMHTSVIRPPNEVCRRCTTPPMGQK